MDEHIVAYPHGGILLSNYRELLSHTTTGTALRIIMLSERNQLKENIKYVSHVKLLENKKQSILWQVRG